MKAKARFVAALAAVYAAWCFVIALPGMVLWSDLTDLEKRAISELVEERAGLIVFTLLVTLAVIGMFLNFLFQRYIHIPLKMREQLAVILGPNRHARLPETGPRELRALAAPINQLADQRDALERDVVEKIAIAKAATEEEKERFAALISELSQSVVVCNADGRVLLYNNRARALFHNNSEMASGSALIGLGRSIFAALDRNLITHSLEKIQQRLRSGEAHPVSNFVTATPSGQLVRTQIAPVFHRHHHTESVPSPGIPTIGGYVLILDDITRRFDLETQRDLLLQSLTEGTRASLANIRAAVENLVEYPDMEIELRDRFTRVVREEVQAMSQRLDRTASEFSNALIARWPLDEMLGIDLIQAVQHRIEQRVGLPTKTEELDDALWIKVDSFSLLQALTYLANRLKEEFHVREVRFRLGASGRHAQLDLVWSGAIVSAETLINWELEPMNTGGEPTPLCLRDVVERNDGELWFQRDKLRHRAFFRILLPIAATPAAQDPAPAASTSRPEYYDFDLFRQTDETRALDERRLAQLAYTVFDTETTGLEPSQGDEIIQIGATRIVNGRLLRSEIFDQMIDPQRPIARESVRIHGITREMLQGQPTISRVLPEFHAFCEDTVLVAHNAAFDMRFLQMKEVATGVAFRQPVLDTLLLSAVIHPNQDSHRLEAIAERLGVNIVGRHTALGDAMVTGEVFLKMIPLLAELGIHTLRDAREASERTYHAKVKY